MSDTQSIADVLKRVLPDKFHPDIPTLAQVLAAAREGVSTSVATESLQNALIRLSGKTLNIQGDSITVGNITGEGIAIGHGAQATVIRIYVPKTPEQIQMWRNRSRMLEKVRTTWIEGFLRRSLYTDALIDLGMQYQQHVLGDPRNMYLHRFGEPDQPLPPGTSIGSVFDTVDNELLILGAPGTGKTTMMLELTRILIERAQQNENLPIPVVFNLSSWAAKRLPLEKWLEEELKNLYSVRSEIAKIWISNDHILPLLDGLDEVRLDARNDCVDAINTFRDKHGLVGMVVCSRSMDYELLTQKLHLTGAVRLQLLTPVQVDGYFRQLKINTTMIQSVYRYLWEATETKRNGQDEYHCDEEVTEQALLRTPLMLQIITMAYANKSMEINYDQTHSFRQLFAHYVDRMLTPRPGALPKTRYTSEQTRHWLEWLASKMLEQNQTVFRIEQLGKDWLQTDRQQRIYATIIGCITGLYVGVLVCVSTWVIWGSIGGILAGSVTGVALGLAFRIDSWRHGTIETVETVTWQWERIKTSQKTFTLYVIFIGIIAVLLGILVSVNIGLPQGIFASSITAVGVLLPLISLMGLSGEALPHASYPNERIWRSLRTFITVVVGCVLGGGTIMGCVGGGLGWLLTDPARAIQLVLTAMVQGAGIGAMAGLFLGGLFYGGLPCLQHSVIRLLLYRYGFIPWNYARFLNYAVDCIFLRKVGGGYIFVHRLLLEYFASLRANSCPEGMERFWSDRNRE